MGLSDDKTRVRMIGRLTFLLDDGISRLGTAGKLLQSVQDHVLGMAESVRPTKQMMMTMMMMMIVITVMMMDVMMMLWWR